MRFAYQSFGIGNTALLAVVIALLGIWGIPRIFERLRPRRPTLKEFIISLFAGALVLFVWMANKIPPLFQEAEPANPVVTNVSQRQLSLAPIAPVVPSTPMKPPFVDPVHEEDVKWKIARDLHILSHKIDGACQAIIVRYPDLYSEHYADDLKEVLDTIGWAMDKTVLSTEPLPNNLSIRTADSGISHACAEALKERLDNTAVRRGNVAYTPIESIAAPTSYMRRCSGPCFEIDIGNDPGP